jgi:hypothetical protein
MARSRIGRPEPPCDSESCDNCRDHDRQHDGERVGHDRRVTLADDAVGREDARLAAHQDEQRKQAAATQCESNRRSGSEARPTFERLDDGEVVRASLPGDYKADICRVSVRPHFIRSSGREAVCEALLQSKY